MTWNSPQICYLFSVLLHNYNTITKQKVPATEVLSYLNMITMKLWLFLAVSVKTFFWRVFCISDITVLFYWLHLSYKCSIKRTYQCIFYPHQYIPSQILLVCHSDPSAFPDYRGEGISEEQIYWAIKVNA